MGDLALRTAEPADRPAVLALLAASLGWTQDGRFRSFYDWKHEQSPFGPSPGLVAVDGDRIVGFRTFLRWEFVGADGETVRAVRAVDTATDPQFQGRGIFRSLTLHAVEELAADGVALVFNTPNAKSRPGYLRMGWIELGRPPASVRFGSVRSVARVAHARVPAERWSTESDVGRPAPEVLADPGLADLLASVAPPTRLRTHRTVAFLRWRYGFGPLGYRAVMRSSRLADGAAVFRLRRRGGALECALADVLVPGGDPAAGRELVREVARTCGADYVIRLHRAPVDRTGFVRLPRLGPVLTWRALVPDAPGGSLDDWDLALGDVELF